MIDHDPDVMSAAQVASLLGVTAARVRQLVQEEKLPAPQILGQRTQVWRRADVEAIATTLRDEGAVTAVSRLLAPAATALTRTFDDVLEYPTPWGPAGHAHVRIFTGPAPEGERTVVVVGELSEEVISVHQHMGTIAQLVDERLIGVRGVTAAWFEYYPHLPFGSSPEHHVDNVLLHVEEPTTRQLPNWRRREAAPAQGRRYTSPSWSPSSVTEVERLIGAPLEVYPDEAYVPETIARWQRAGAAVPFTIDPDQLRSRFAALETLEQVPADALRHPAALAACPEIADTLTLSLDLAAHSQSTRTDGTTPKRSLSQDEAWPTVFAAYLEPYAPGPLDQQRLASHMSSSTARKREGHALADLLHQLLLWELETGQYADTPQPRLHAAVTTAADVVRFQLSQNAPEHLPRRRALHQPRLFEVIGEHDQSYLDSIGFIDDGQTPLYRMLRATLPTDPDAAYHYRYGRDPWNRAVAHAHPEASDRQAWMAIDWPGTPPRNIPPGTHLVADGQAGSRPVYLQHPDGRLDLLPRGHSSNDWNFGYGGGGPGALVDAITHAIADYAHLDVEDLPRAWIDDQVCYSSQDQLRISIDDLLRRIKNRGTSTSSATS